MKKILFAGAVTGLVLLGVSLAYNFVVSPILFPETTKEYVSSGLFRPWTDPLMSLIFIYPFVVGFGLSYAWNLFKKVFSGKNPVRRGFRFAMVYILIATIPGMLISYSSFTVSQTMIISWTLSGIIEALTAGWLLARLNA